MSIPRRIRRRLPNLVPIGPAVWQPPRLWDFWALPPRNAPFVLRSNLFGIYPFPDESAHVCQIWCQSVQPFGSFSWICATLVRLLATGHAVSRKNTPKNNIYTSKTIIPARTCRHPTSLTFFTAIFVALAGALAEELMICCRHVRTELYI